MGMARMRGRKKELMARNDTLRALAVHPCAVVAPVLALVLLITPGEPARSQTGEVPEQSVTVGDAASRYEGQYGDPEFWTLSLLVGPDARPSDIPSRKSIRTVGRVHAVELPGRKPQVRLCIENHRGCLDLDEPVREISHAFFAEAISRHDDVAQVVGAFGIDGDGFGFWSFSSAPRGAERNPTLAITLENLIISPTEYVGRTVVVRGRFQGRNLFEDMPKKSAIGRDDWVLKDGVCFIWITGHPAQGDGFSLDLDDRTAAAYRLEVQGEPEVRDGLVYLKASSVRVLGRAADNPES